MIKINKRKVGISIVLSLITAGIYLIYWKYLLVKNIRALKGDESSCTGEMLCLILVPFYSLYWWYTRGEFVKRYCDEHQFPSDCGGIIYLILGLFGWSIVSVGIMQNDFNSLPYEPAQSKHSNTMNPFIIIALVIISIGLSALGYTAMKKHDQKIQNEARFDTVCKFVQSDSDFISQYGEIQKMALYEKESIVFVEDNICHIPCVITTNSEQTYLVWVEYDFSGEERVFKYVSITPMNNIAS